MERESKDGKSKFLISGDDPTEISHLALRIQLSATAVATSFLLIFVPNVETITLTAFILGFLFPYRFALTTILTMALTWEILASMVFAFSGITFPFKIIAWLIIGSFGRLARAMRSRYFYEFMILGALSALLFDFLVTIPTAFLFIRDDTAFLTIFFSNLILGALFTVTHTISNAIFFSFIPIILRSILPLLHDNYPELVEIPLDRFDYLKNLKSDIAFLSVVKLDPKRILIYSGVGILVLLLLVAGTAQFLKPKFSSSTTAAVAFKISYDGVLPNESYSLIAMGNETVLMILERIAVVNYTMQYLSEPYIQAINGVWENQNLTGHFWLYYINDSWVNSGANSTYLEDGDVVSWRYQ